MHHESMTTVDMKPCIEDCSQCHQVCLQTAMNYCLTTGGKHVEPEHYRLVMNCAAICQLASDFQLSGSAYCKELCELCATICEACAKSCEALGEMKECVAACIKCAKSCKDLVASTIKK